jgi:hypothetical protein
MEILLEHFKCTDPLHHPKSPTSNKWNLYPPRSHYKSFPFHRDYAVLLTKIFHAHTMEGVGGKGTLTSEGQAPAKNRQVIPPSIWQAAGGEESAHL